MTEFCFQKAVAVWAYDREKEMNCELSFRTVVSKDFCNTAILSLAVSSLYRVWVNGTFVAAGPARAAHGFYRVDELDVASYLTQSENVIVIDVVGYNVNSFDTLDQPSFLTAELLYDGVPVRYTGDDGFRIYDLKQRIQRVQRYSFQRAFVDCYSYSCEKQKVYTNALDGNDGSFENYIQPPAKQTGKKYITRDVALPEFEQLKVEKQIETGLADYHYVCPNPARDRSYIDISNTLKGFPLQELEEHLSEEAQNIAWVPNSTQEKAGNDMFPLYLNDSYGMYAFPYDATGFLRLEVECESPCVLYAIFDEVLCDGQMDFKRFDTCSCLKYYLDAGKHEIMTFAAYVMKYVKVAVKGTCKLVNMDMVEYKHRKVSYEPKFPKCEPQKLEKLHKIYHAALESFRANALDIFMDCPSRERAGWLCDSFFAARNEFVLTGKSEIERAFLDNFLMVDEFDNIPEGMLPMCYPADHPDENFIPNWAMWFVLQLEEYEKRSGDRTLIERARDKVYDLLRYFEKYENADGLLENLDGWVFVEWSRANDEDLIQDINFPTNMVYSKMLRAVANLYQDSAMIEKALRLRKVIRERSFRNGFYTDNEKRTETGYVNPENHTEVCQYYAFFTGIATKEEDKELWDVLVRDFGPDRKQTKLHPQVSFANAFVGNYLRIELLYLDGQYDKVLDNILGYFTGMAEKTGTLWEHDSTVASCNHGFAAHVIYWLDGIQ